jgi:hypothetical protein
MSLPPEISDENLHLAMKSRHDSFIDLVLTDTK